MICCLKIHLSLELGYVSLLYVTLCFQSCRFYPIGPKGAMPTTETDRNICARRCSNDVGNLASVDNVPKKWCCSVPNSCTAAVADDNVVLIEVISELHGVGICG